jgi:hypothetical protein
MRILVAIAGVNVSFFAGVLVAFICYTLPYPRVEQLNRIGGVHSFAAINNDVASIVNMHRYICAAHKR